MIDDNGPAISVIVPVYNSDDYLSECLESILSQGSVKIEIICINDGSTDSSLDILRKYQKSDSRIRVFSQENSGVSSARNLGLREARGECVLFVDSDDRVDIKMTEILWARYKKYNADIVVFGGATFPTVDWIDKKLDTRNVVYSFDSINALFYETGSIPFGCNKMFRLDLIRGRGVQFERNLDLGEDQVFQFMLFPAARNIVFTKEKLYFYRNENKNSAMAKYGDKFKLKNDRHLQIARTIIYHWGRLGYLSGNERHLMRWLVRFFKNCAIDSKVHANYFSREVSKLFGIVGYDPNSNDDFFKSHRMIVENARQPFSPKISVVVPVFNVESVLNECVDSILAQTFKDFEVIFVDDGSTDNSLNILRYYEDRDPRVRVFRQNNSFAGVARNRGIDESSGDYLVFLDSDDVFRSDLLMEMYNSVTENNCEICVCGAVSLDHATGKTNPMPWVCKTRFLPDGTIFSRNSYDFCRYIYCFTTPAPWNKIFKRDFIIRNNIRFQSNRSANDVYFVFMALSIASRIVVNQKELVKYRVNNSNSLQSTQDKDVYAFYDALRKLKFGLVERGVYEDVRDQFVNFALDICLYNLGTIRKMENFCDLYDFIKRRAYVDLDILEKSSDFFYGYSPNNGERKVFLERYSANEYAERYGVKVT